MMLKMDLGGLNRLRAPRSACVRRGLASILIFCVLGWGASAAAQEQVRQKFSDRIHVVQPKPVLQKYRLDIAPRFGYSINDAIRSSAKIGVNANFHFSERVYLGGLFEWYDFGGVLGGTTDAYDEAFNATTTTVDAPVLNYAAGLEVGYAPIVGKFALFNSAILYYDIAVTIGGVFANSESIVLSNPSSGPGATLSLMNRVFLSQWMALTFEVRDVAFFQRVRGADGESLSHMLTVGAGLSFYIPPSFDYGSRDEEAL